MAARLPTKALSLKQFMVRRQVLGLYRDLMKALNKIPDKNHQKELKEWTREEFKQNKTETDPAAIQFMITRGQQALREIASTISLAK
ncbi:predicted protein [Nematostella vectensis]|uniref:LYR motif-containing protein 2 n=1 Tax=Nematostella vectensis TaxID=45351 RepID=A7S5E6_NEMVE|nr:LYR motif-containing protein 2 [Nematostella vectensis]EDO41072.1 predicted protein [Nematostella vectensis]|eukprot:XP_001633135.1 predicted protein [Nematostella vectensis]